MTTQRSPLLQGMLVITFALLSVASTAQSLPPTSADKIFVMVDGRVVGTMVLDTTARRQLENVERTFTYHEAKLMDERGVMHEGLVQERLRQLNAQRLVDIQELLTAEQYAEWSELVRLGEATTERQ